MQCLSNMSKQAMKELDWAELLPNYPYLLMTMPTSLKTPYYCYLAVYSEYGDEITNQKGDEELFQYIPPSMRLKTMQLYYYFENEQFPWYDEDGYEDLPYVRPYNERKDTILTNDRCIVCGERTEATLGEDKKNLEYLHCCDYCLKNVIHPSPLNGCYHIGRKGKS